MRIRLYIGQVCPKHFVPALLIYTYHIYNINTPYTLYYTAALIIQYLIYKQTNVHNICRQCRMYSDHTYHLPLLSYASRPP